MSQAVVVKATPTTAMANAHSSYGISQRRRRGRRINIFGVWLPKHCFDYALMVRTLHRSYFCAVNELASPEGVSALPGDRTNNCVRVGQRFGASRSTNARSITSNGNSKNCCCFSCHLESPQMNRIG